MLPSIGVRPSSRGEEEGEGGGGVEEVKSLTARLDRMQSRFSAMAEHVDHLTKALSAEADARVQSELALRKLLMESQRPPPVVRSENINNNGYNRRRNAENEDPEAVVQHQLAEYQLRTDAKFSQLMSMLRDGELSLGGGKGGGGGGLGFLNEEKLISLAGDVESLSVNSQQQLALLGALQAHMAEERMHRLTGQQELREVVSAEITARRKAQAKSSAAMERVLVRSEEESLSLRRESVLLAESINGKIQTIETNLVSVTSSVFSEVKDIREYTRDMLEIIREEISKLQTSVGGPMEAMAAELHLSLSDKIEQLNGATNTKISQLESQSKTAIMGLANRLVQVELDTSALHQTLEAEIASRFQGDASLQLNMETSVQAFCDIRIGEKSRELEKDADSRLKALSENLASAVKEEEEARKSEHGMLKEFFLVVQGSATSLEREIEERKRQEMEAQRRLDELEKALKGIAHGTAAGGGESTLSNAQSPPVSLEVADEDQIVVAAVDPALTVDVDVTTVDLNNNEEEEERGTLEGGESPKPENLGDSAIGEGKSTELEAEQKKDPEQDIPLPEQEQHVSITTTTEEEGGQNDRGALSDIKASREEVEIAAAKDGRNDAPVLES